MSLGDLEGMELAIGSDIDRNEPFKAKFRAIGRLGRAQ